MKKRLTLNTVAVALRAFPPLSQRCALRAGGRHRCGGAALARWPLAWAAPVCGAADLIFLGRGPMSVA